MMRREEALAWFEELEGRAKSLPIEKFGIEEIKAHQMQAFQAWMTEAETAIDGVFPPTHAIRTKWAKAEKSLSTFNDSAYVVGDAVIGVFQAAMSIIRSDRLGSSPRPPHGQPPPMSRGDTPRRRSHRGIETNAAGDELAVDAQVLGARSSTLRPVTAAGRSPTQDRSHDTAVAQEPKKLAINLTMM